MNEAKKRLRKFPYDGCQHTTQASSSHDVRVEVVCARNAQASKKEDSKNADDDDDDDIFVTNSTSSFLCVVVAAGCKE